MVRSVGKRVGIDSLCYPNCVRFWIHVLCMVFCHIRIFKDKGINLGVYIRGFRQLEALFIFVEQIWLILIGRDTRNLDAWAKHHGFLDVAKASKSERNMGLQRLPKTVMEIGDERPSGNSWERRDKRQTTARANIHPTVKPIKLMAYLVELGCPEDGLVLDPFCGSGSTLIAAHRLNRKWLGIELNPEYAEITRHRLSVLNQKLTDY